jgi:glutathione synthase/RimK-type ligase-like ATP-grasp enzyme
MTPKQSAVTIRWGESRTPDSGQTLTLNDRLAVKKASNKHYMLKSLKLIEGVRTPQYFDLIEGDRNTFDIERFKDSSGYFYVRGRDMVVRYDNQLRPNDLYITRPISNKKEYRVHVFNGKILGVYEKIPNDSNVKIYKSHNCQFRKCNPEISTCNYNAQQMCIKAVQGLGLLFGGVDIIFDRDKKRFYVIEVNSSPGLNSLNLDIWVNNIVQYINEQRGTNGSINRRA